MQPILFGFISIALYVLMLLVGAFRPHQPRLSEYEVQRRAKNGDSNASGDLRRAKSYQTIRSYQFLVTGLLTILLSAVTIGWLGWSWGIFAGLVALFMQPLLIRISVLKRFSQTMYDSYENSVINFVSKQTYLSRFVQVKETAHGSEKLYSRSELEHLVQTADTIVSEEERQRIIAGLRFTSRLVGDTMTAIAKVKTIKRTEILGPLVLDDLHKSGHSKFPVIDDNKNIIGILTVRDVLTVDTTRKHTAMVETAMSKKLFYVRNDQPLSAALAAFMSTHSHLLIVIDADETVVGILSLHDTLEALIGKTLHDSFNDYDDKSAVATRTS